jgi:hypothetical protein
LEALTAAAAQRLVEGQQVLDLGLADTGSGGAPLEIVSSQASHLWAGLCRAYCALGFDSVLDGDEVLRDLVLARIIEPSSKIDAERVLTETGVAAASYRTVKRRLPVIAKPAVRQALSAACAAHAGLGPASLVLFDVSTLYFETDTGDGFREPGFSNYADLRIMPMWPQECLLMKRFTPRNVGIIWFLVRTLDCPSTQQRRPATPATRTRRRLGHGTVPHTNWPSAQP